MCYSLMYNSYRTSVFAWSFSHLKPREHENLARADMLDQFYRLFGVDSKKQNAAKT